MKLSSSNALPLVLLFERHWDEAPKQLLKNLLPQLAGEGYDTFCLESPQDLNSKVIVQSQKEHLDLDSSLYSDAEHYLQRAGIKVNTKLSDMGFLKLSKLMELYVSSQRFHTVAEKIKNLPGSFLMRDVLKDVQRLSFDVKGVDINFEDYKNIVSHELAEKVERIDKNEDYRITTMIANLTKLRNEGKGVVFLCGALHAGNLMTRFKENNTQNDVLLYFPHSSKRYDESYDDLKEALIDETLKNHTYCLISELQNKSLVTKIISEVKSKNTKYREEVIGGTSNSIFLSKIFQVEFKAFLKPGYYVDALLEENETDHYKEIISKLATVNIQTHKTSLEGCTYAVIRDINTNDVSEKIRRL